ncbi:MOSC domain-containing protein [Oceanobacter kriegii]|uniref:MOSC domain-containing protein n=1 Tax=Oceanobacter kriegii TaxID=64972 RepID=UPI000416BCF2|nr:MOSC N-terminal beta barrel domain-containing protein [Oceanobacter kriegii]
MTDLTVTRLFIYPVKSCAGIEVDRIEFDRQGPLHDRRFMVVSPEGKFLTQRQLPLMAHIQTELLENGLRLSLAGPLSATGSTANSSYGACDIDLNQQSSWQSRQVTVWGDEVSALDCGDEVGDWLTTVLGRDARLVYMPANIDRQVDPERAAEQDLVAFADGFPLLVCTEESLAALSSEAGLTIDMLRFRPNVVVAGDAAFAELDWRRMDVVDGEQSDAALLCLKPCTRCVIPTRDIDSLEKQPDVVAALKALCLSDKGIVFGQNAVVRSIDALQVGMVFSAVK